MREWWNLADTHVCGDVSTVIKFLNDFEKAEYSLASLKKA